MLKFLVKADGILHDVCAAVRTEVVETAYLGNTPGAELVATSKCHLELPRTIRIAAHRAGFSRCQCSGRTTCTSLNPSERQLTGVAEIQPHKVCERGLHGSPVLAEYDVGHNDVHPVLEISRVPHLVLFSQQRNKASLVYGRRVE